LSGEYITYRYDALLDNSKNLDIYIHSEYTLVLITSRTEGSMLVKDHNDGTFTKEAALDSYYQGSFDQNFLINLDGEGDSEVIINFGNMLAVLSSKGEILATHSFTSDIITVVYWQPDFSNIPAMVAVLVSGDIEISDPLDREFSRKLAIPVKFSTDLDIERDLLIIGEKPLPIWTVNNADPETKSSGLRNDMKWIVVISVLLIALPLLSGRNFTKILSKKV
ncbi:MAG: hypothetical protein ACW96X_13350, partial [Promethearchaeota archaeon]